LIFSIPDGTARIYTPRHTAQADFFTLVVVAESPRRRTFLLWWLWRKVRAGGLFCFGGCGGESAWADFCFGGGRKSACADFDILENKLLLP
jgi:hypothetical protein